METSWDKGSLIHEASNLEFGAETQPLRRHSTGDKYTRSTDTRDEYGVPFNAVKGIRSEQIVGGGSEAGRRRAGGRRSGGREASGAAEGLAAWRVAEVEGAALDQVPNSKRR